MYGQMTAGSWIYIGSQGIVQGTYECFAEIARRRFGGSLAGTITLTAGLGGMGGAQPLAVTMNDGRRALHRGRPRADPSAGSRPAISTSRPTTSSDAIERCRDGEGRAPRAQRRALRERRRGACPSCSARLRGRRGHRPDAAPTTRSSATSRPGSRSPRPTELRERDPDEYIAPRPRRDRRPLLRDGRLPGRRGRGVRLRQQPARARPELGGFERAFDYPGFVPAYIRPLFCEGKGPFRWVALSGDPGRHRRHRPRGARGVPRRRGARALDPDGRRADRLPGPAGADLLARLRRAAPARAALQRDGRAAASCGRRS